MDTQTLLAVIGIAATILLGLWAITITVRYNRSVRITYAHDQAIALTDDITQNFPELGIVFRGEPVSQNLVLLKGYLINTGKKDISREMVEERITLELPENYEWVECKVVESSPSLKANAIKCDSMHVAFETGLWKAKEYMKFEALAKVPVVKANLDNPPADRPTLRLRKALSFSHRIADSSRIVETRVPRPLGRKNRIPIPGLPLHLVGSARLNVFISLLMIGIGITMWGVGRFVQTDSFGYAMVIEGKQHMVSMGVKKGMITVSDDAGFRRSYTPHDFDAIPDKHPQIIPRTDKDMRIVGIIYGILGLFMLAFSSIRGVREKRLLGIIANRENH